MRLTRLPAQARRLFCVVMGLCGVLAAPGVRAQEAETRPIRFPLHPSLSADGKTLAFAWQGDIWTVPAEGGRAQRFTIHEAYDTIPRWSTDGKWLAFTSDRAGNDDVWIMPATGGKARQLTFHSAPDRVSAWTPDSKEILFTSNRETTRTTCIYAVNIATGRTRKVAEDHDPLSGATVTPDGTHVACVCSGTLPRKVYRGSANAKLMLFPMQGGPGKWLVKETDNARWAMFAPDGKTFTYVSDRDGTANLWRRAVTGEKPTPLTHFKAGNILYPTLSKDGSKVVFMHDFALWSVSTRGGEPKELRIFAPTDERTSPIRRETFTTGAQEAALSPNGRNLAFIAHGEIFVEPASGAPAVDPDPEDETSPAPKKTGSDAPVFRNVMRLTDTPQREKEIAWSPDGKQIAFTSDRDGNNNLYITDVKTRIARRLTQSANTEHSPLFSPDGKQIAFLRGYNGSELCLVPAVGGETRVLVHDPDISGVAWSPDAQWLAYARLKAHSGGQASDIFVLNLAAGKATNITRYPALNTDPAWSPDGQTLYFLSNRTTNLNLWSVSLLIEKPKTGSEDTAKPAEPPRPTDPAKPAEKKPIAIKIDFEDIHQRAKQLTTLDGVGNYAVSPDSKSIVFAGRALSRPDLWRIAAAGGAAARLTQSGEAAGSIEFAPDGSRIVYLAAGSIRSLALGAPGAEPASIPFSARMDVDTRAEMLELFDEAWRTLRDAFYDPRMHGVDWNHVRDLYRPVVEDLTYKEDFYLLFELVMGELNCSHVGIGNPAARAALVTPSLGVAYDNDYTGPGVRIASVMPKGPADRERSRLKVGDILLKVDDQPIMGNETFYHLLDDKAGRNVDLLVSADGKESGAHIVHIRPILAAAYRLLEYDRMVKEREQRTDKLSGGRIGYVHLSAMDQPNLEKFKRLVFGDYSDKEGIIVDVRDNGGGSTAPQILEVLQNRISGYRTIRDDPRRTTSPLLAWTKPTLMLTNENSYSNAEVLPWGFKELGLGKIVGVATHGAVIGTGATTLLDGTTLRLPEIGAYTLSGKNMENNGCPPDILVENTPDDLFQHNDRQLERGVEELLKQLPSPAPNR